MVVWISGSRTITSYSVVSKIIEACGFEIEELAHGDQPGAKVNDQWIDTVDRLAGRWARENGIPVKPVPANWLKFGLAAGPIRNREGLLYVQRRAREVGVEAGALIQWDGKSRGANDSFDKAKYMGLETCRATVGKTEAEVEYFNSDREKFVLALG